MAIPAAIIEIDIDVEDQDTREIEVDIDVYEAISTLNSIQDHATAVQTWKTIVPSNVTPDPKGSETSISGKACRPKPTPTSDPSTTSYLNVPLVAQVSNRVSPSWGLPSGVIGTGVIATGLRPSGMLPTGIVPSGVVPSGVVPSGVIPSGGYQTTSTDCFTLPAPPQTVHTGAPTYTLGMGSTSGASRTRSYSSTVVIAFLLCVVLRKLIAAKWA